MEQYYFECQNCKKRFPYGDRNICSDCGGILVIRYGAEYMQEAEKKMKAKERESIWDYAPVFPKIQAKNVVSFREGNTPLVKSREMAQKLDMTELYFKDETKNPTGSFKDRAISVCVSVAKELGYKGIAAASSGNGGASTSAYGVKGGLPTIIFVPETTPQGKVTQAITYGGSVIKVKGNFSRSFLAARQMAEKEGYMNVTTTYQNPWGIEGYKTLAYEIYDDLGKEPDTVILPVGDGPILYGVYKGFSELREMGRINKVPRLICVQAKGCAPIAEAWIQGKKVEAWENPCTVASAISDPLKGYEEDGELTVKAVKETDGYACTPDDMEILEAGRTLARTEGLYVEPSSAAAAAALMKLREEKVIGRDDCCVCILTGHGLKDCSAYVPEKYEALVINQIEEIPEEYLRGDSGC